ncbi:MAG: pimeloyl-ACP methyl ester carboxylesterase [Saprospiraceae bacterium]|jgi:pimeloyl-ACP methyl ester carboxylesterase
MDTNGFSQARKRIIILTNAASKFNCTGQISLPVISQTTKAIMSKAKKKWCLRKRFWLLTIMALIFVLGRMEFAKMRYDIDTLTQAVISKGQKKPAFKQKKINTRTLNYLQIGDDSSLPLVVLVHGSPGSLSAYEDYFSDTSFTRGINLIAIDRLGFGYSDFGKSELSLAVQANLLAEVLKDFPGSKKILVGHSMGGPVIAKTAIEYPELTDGLVMVAPSVSPGLEPSNTWRLVLNFPLIRWLIPPALNVCNQEIIPLKEELEKMMAGWEGITIPVTVIQGEEDDIVPAGNAPFVKEMVINSPSVQVKMVTGGNHFILWSEISLVQESIMEVVHFAKSMLGIYPSGCKCPFPEPRFTIFEPRSQLCG